MSVHKKEIDMPLTQRIVRRVSMLAVIATAALLQACSVPGDAASQQAAAAQNTGPSVASAATGVYSNVWWDADRETMMDSGMVGE
jgi:hypothetical protein